MSVFSEKKRRKIQACIGRWMMADDLCDKLTVERLLSDCEKRAIELENILFPKKKRKP